MHHDTETNMQDDVRDNMKLTCKMTCRLTCRMTWHYLLRAWNRQAELISVLNTFKLKRLKKRKSLSFSRRTQPHRRSPFIRFSTRESANEKNSGQIRTQQSPFSTKRARKTLTQRVFDRERDSLRRFSLASFLPSSRRREALGTSFLSVPRSPRNFTQAS